MTKEKGFTLLELCICLVLFGIFIECLGGFLTHCVMRYKQYRNQLELTNEGQNVEDFIREGIRKAEKVQIKTESGKVIEAINPSLSHETADIEKEQLERIKCVRTVVEDGRQMTKTYRLEIKKSGSSCPGKYTLVYNGGYVSNVICDQIEYIKVTRKKDSNRIQFECRLEKKDETNKTLNCVKRFSESIQDKGVIK